METWILAGSVLGDNAQDEGTGGPRGGRQKKELRFGLGQARGHGVSR